MTTTLAIVLVVTVIFLFAHGRFLAGTVFAAIALPAVLLALRRERRV